MNDEQTALAKRLVAHEKWRWVEGMAAIGGRRVSEVDRRGQAYTVEETYDGESNLVYSRTEVYELHINDYATASILLRMAMEACAKLPQPGRTYPGPVPSVGLLSGAWSFSPDDHEHRHQEFEGVDLGTVAAQALLAAWGP